MHHRRIRLFAWWVGAVLCAILSLNGELWGAREDASSSFFKEARAAFEKGQYQQALDHLAQASTDHPLSVEALRLKTQSLLHLGKPKEALVEYERLEQRIGHDDMALLKDVALVFIVSLTKDMREQMRGAAYTALKDVESAETVPYFEQGLSDDSGLVRALVVEGLGKTAAGRRSTKLRKAVDDQAGLVRAAVLKVLATTGDRATVPLFEKALEEDQPVVRLAAAGALYRAGRKAMWERVRDAAKTANPEERATALRLMGDLGDDRALPVLLEAMGDTQPSVRGAAASALGDLARSEGIVPLERALEDVIPAVRTSAAVGLGEMNARRSIPALSRALSDRNPIVQAASISALLRMEQPLETMMGAINQLLGEQDPGIRSAVARALGRAPVGSHEAAVAILNTLLVDPIPRPRIAAARSLGQIADQAVIPTLKRALHDEDDAVRAAAGGALGRVLNMLDKSTKQRKT